MLAPFFPTLILFFGLASVVSSQSFQQRNESAGLAERLSWAHSSSHPVHTLFSRAPPPEGPAIGSPEWSRGYPSASPSEIAQLPPHWKAALDSAVSENRIPNIPPSRETEGNPVYPNGQNPNSPEICSSTYKCRLPQDIWDAPEGVFASSFDDGPLPPSSRLVQFLSHHEITTTHFLIGLNILQNPSEFRDIIESQNDLAVHTWSHRHMTTLSNEDITGELGWTMAIIYDSTGRLPKYWRPPFGDSDARVSAIAREVFGLHTVLWNQDTADWGISSGSVQEDQIDDAFMDWISGPKSPGLVPLEHELSDATINAFIRIYPEISTHGWRYESLADVYDGTYQEDPGFLALFGDASLLESTTTSSTTSTSSSSTASQSLTSTLSSTITSPTLTSSLSAASAGASSSDSTDENLSVRSVVLNFPLTVVWVASFIYFGISW